MDKNEIAWRSNKQEFAEEFSERGVLGESVAEDVVGKIYCPCREDPLSLLENGHRDDGSGKLASVGQIVNFCREKNQHPLIVVGS